MSTHATTYGEEDIDQVEQPRGDRALGDGGFPYLVGGQGVGVGTLDDHLRSPTPLKTMPRNKLVHLFVDALARVVAQERELRTLRKHLSGRPAR